MINDEIKSIIKSATADYGSDHWREDDFDSQRQRIHYLEEIADGSGWNDEAEEGVAEYLDGQTWEDANGVEHEIDLDDQDVLDYIAECVCEEAEYWLED